MPPSPMATTTVIESTERSAASSVDPLESLLSGKNSKHFYRAAVASIIVFYLALAIGRTLTDSPGCDEGWFASPALNLTLKGQMGTTVIEESNLGMTTGIHQYTYWIMPLHVLTQAVWYKAFGFGLFSMRSISIVCGLLALAAWLSIMQSLSGDKKIILLALALVALDFAFIRSASTGRMDMMSAALNFTAFAAYLRLRNRNLTLAILVSQSFVVASGLTHPNGFLGFIGLAFLTLYFDRLSLLWRHILIAAVPYSIGLAAYGLYVMRDPDLFLTQLGGNGGGRLWGVANPWGALKFEIAERYLGLGGPGQSYLKIALVLVYAIGVGGAIFTREIRQHKGYRALLIGAAIYFTYLTMFEGTKLFLYMVHITPLYAALLAVWISWCWSSRSVPRWILAPALCSLILLHLTGSVYVMLRNSYQNSYLPAVSFLNQHSDQKSLIMGTAEIGFGLKFPDTLLDDKWLGYNTGRSFDFVVEDTRYEREQLWAQTRRPEIYEHVRTLLTGQYQQVYNQASYRIYARQGGNQIRGEAKSATASPGIKTDRAVYPEPPPPPLPAAGGTFVDPTFGTTIMRLTDAKDGTFNVNGYSYWPSFNKDSTRLWVITNPGPMLYTFDPVNFRMSNKHLLFSRLPNGHTPDANDATWSGTDADVIVCHDGLKLYRYNVVNQSYTLMKDFASHLPPGNLWQMSMSIDDNSFGFTVRDTNGKVTGYIAWRRSQNSLYRGDNAPGLDEVQVDKTGQYLVVKTGQSGAEAVSVQIVNLLTRRVENLVGGTPDYAPGHSDVGHGFVVGGDNWRNTLTYRNLATPHTLYTVFDFPDWGVGAHVSMLADDEKWIVMSTFLANDSPSTRVFRNELFQIATDGSKRVRRLAHLHSVYRDYWDTPRANISRDGRFAVFTSNWGATDRRDVFIVRIPAPGSEGTVASSLGVSSTRRNSVRNVHSNGS